MKNGECVCVDDSQICRQRVKGVELILYQDMKKGSLEQCQLPDRILVKLIGKLFKTGLNTEEEIDESYSTLDNTKTKCKSQEITIIGDMNAKIEKEPDSKIFGKSRLITHNK